MSKKPVRTHPLVVLAEALAARTAWTDGAMSQAILGGGGLFKRLREVTPKTGRPRSCSLLTYERALQWFSDHWPADLDWPADIPRPAPTKKEAA